MNALTDRELEVVTLAANGLTTAGMAERLGVHPATVARILTEARWKTGAANTAHLVYLCTRAGWITESIPGGAA